MEKKQEVLMEDVMDEDYKWDDKQVDIKFAINAIVWEHLPGKVTLDEAEDVAISILDIFFKQYDRFDK